MQRVLFNQTIFGPIHSRRLGASLGVNLSPTDGKTCTFDCLYCEAGYNAQGPGTSGLPPRQTVRNLLDEKLAAMAAQNQSLDVITFSGNGEPTIHPEFQGIIDDTIELRNKYFPNVKISVLTNSTRVHTPQVFKALCKVDNNIVKLDSAINQTVALLDRPTSPTFNINRVVENLTLFNGQCIVQTMFTRGSHNGIDVDNTTPAEINALIQAYKTIRPKQIMIYSIDRKTPEESLQKISPETLREIAAQIQAETNIPVTTA